MHLAAGAPGRPRPTDPRRAIGSVLAAACGALALAGGPPTRAAGGGTGSLAASLVGYALDGRSVDLAARAGWRVVYFWTDGCPCVRACERFTLRPLARKYAGQVAFYAVASSRYDLDRPPAALRASVAAHALPFPVLLDPGHRLARALGAQVTPQTFLLDPQGRVVFAGMPDDSRRYLRATGRAGVTQTFLARALAQALAGRPVRPARTEDEGCVIAW